MGKDAGCENTVIERVDWHEADAGDRAGPQLSVTVHVRPHKRLAGRCWACGKRRPGYDRGEGRRRQYAAASTWVEVSSALVRAASHLRETTRPGWRSTRAGPRSSA